MAFGSKRNKGKPPMSGTSSSVSSGANIPPGASDPNVTDRDETLDPHHQPNVVVEGSDAKYPEVPLKVMTAEEEHQKAMADAEERIARAKKVSAPKKLKPRELDVCKWFAETYIEENDSPTKDIPLDDIPQDYRAVFSPLISGNLTDRGIFAYSRNEAKQPTHVHFTEVGFDLYMRTLRNPNLTTTTGGKTSTAKVSTTSGGSTTSKYSDNLRLKLMVEGNPRRERTHGYYSWQLYSDGINYHEYMKSDYDKSLMTDVGTPFGGPGRNHWDWDLMRGFTALYNSNESEFLEDGKSLNPRYWYINNSGKDHRLDVDHTEEGEKAAD